MHTGHILFIASGRLLINSNLPGRCSYIIFLIGAFHKSSPSDLMPELQGRLPIRVNLASLTENDFVRILKETQVSS